MKGWIGLNVDVNCKSVLNIDIDSGEAFRILVKTLHMNCILNEDHNYYTCKDSNDELHVYRMVNGHDELYDDRGELYEALINVANCIF